MDVTGDIGFHRSAGFVSGQFSGQLFRFAFVLDFQLVGCQFRVGNFLLQFNDSVVLGGDVGFHVVQLFLETGHFFVVCRGCRFQIVELFLQIGDSGGSCVLQLFGERCLTIKRGVDVGFGCGRGIQPKKTDGGFHDLLVEFRCCGVEFHVREFLFRASTPGLCFKILISVN